MEDALAAFADMLDDGADEQVQFGVGEVDDYGRLDEYNNGFADFAMWEGAFECRQSVGGESQVTEVVDQSGGGEAEGFGDAAQSLLSPDIAPPDAGLRAEMLELLSIFQVVYENKAAVDTRSLLKKCAHMCERIMERYCRLPQVVAMYDQARALLQMFENGGGPESPFARSTVASNFATENSISSGARSFRHNPVADVKEALDRVDRDARESDDFKDPDEGRVINGVYRYKAIWYCQLHTDQEQCRQCGVDYRLLNQVHRSRTGEARVDDIVRKEQERLEELERQRINQGHADPRVQGQAQVFAEDFASIAKELNEELARARETDKVSSLKCFSPLFQISEERKLVL